MMMNNQNGQALIESLGALPVVIACLSLALGGLYVVSAEILVDHYNHQAALCLAKQESIKDCRYSLKQKISQLPWLKLNIHRFHRSTQSIESELTVHFPFGAVYKFREHFTLPLKPKDFTGE